MAEQPNNQYVRRKLSEHDEVHERFDKRIGRNEQWRLQMQGALKFAAFTLGSGGALTLILLLTGVV